MRFPILNQIIYTVILKKKSLRSPDPIPYESTRADRN